ncbi:MAG: hypothetical protein A2X49_10680 [Lentisphaerae bacterium GWF2_52_8]|nr:MAG: hypothetical protein A2X49_10680 [Lentisphaerae bacterium GWF2_52_8]
MSSREQIIEKIDSIPGIPVSAAKAIQLLQNPQKNMSEVIRVIEYDPGITANILKLVNSSAFAAERRISSLQEATVRIGANNLLQMLVGSSMAGLLSQKVKGYDLPAGELWRSSIASAIYTDILRDTLHLQLPHYTFTAGLLHDVGKIVLGSFIDVNAAEIVSYSVNNRISFVEAEQHILGIDHPEAGALLLHKWNLPQELENPVRWHHNPEKCPGDALVTEVVHIADALTIMEGIGTGCEGLNYRLSDRVASKLGLTIDMIEQIVCKAQIRREEIKDILADSSQ